MEPPTKDDPESAPTSPSLSDTVPASSLADPRPATSPSLSDTLQAPSSQRPASTPPPAPRYAPRELLGQGGMGEVWLYYDATLERDVALKRLHGNAHDAVGRFVREARVQGQIDHPGVVPVYDLGTAPDGAMYFTMRRIRGRTLEDVLAALAKGDAETRARYSRRKLLTALTSVCLAVHFAHSKGVLHRDLKPANVMFGDFGEVYVLDWGLAKRVGAPAPAAEQRESFVTGMGQILGTPGYMSPEQFRGQNAELDARSDVYSLGAILYETLTLARLHPGESVPAVAVSTMTGRDARPSLRAPDVPPELDAICVKATALRPEDRYETARELSDAIERFLDGDRDVEQRRELAARHAARAAEALARVSLPDASPGDADAARAEATREVIRALSIDPEHAEARGTLVRLVVEAPDRMPPAAVAAMERHVNHSRREALGVGWKAYLSWIACVPVVIALGLRSPAPLAIGTALIAAAVVLARHMYRANATDTRHGLALMLLSFASIGLFSTWLGPFVLAPVATAIMTAMFAAQATRRERPIAIGLGALTALAPFLVEFTRLFPPAYAFRDGTVVLFPRVVELHPTGTILALMYTSVAFAVLPSIVMGRMRDALSRAERKLFVQAWHFDQLTGAGHAARTSAAPPGAQTR